MDRKTKLKKKIDSWRGEIWIINAFVENNIKFQLSYNTLEFEILLKVWILREEKLRRKLTLVDKKKLVLFITLCLVQVYVIVMHGST